MSEQASHGPEQPNIINENDLTYKQRLNHGGEFSQNFRQDRGIGIEEGTEHWVALNKHQAAEQPAENPVEAPSHEVNARGRRRATRPQGPSPYGNPVTPNIVIKNANSAPDAPEFDQGAADAFARGGEEGFRQYNWDKQGGSKELVRLNDGSNELVRVNNGNNELVKFNAEKISYSELLDTLPEGLLGELDDLMDNYAKLAAGRERSQINGGNKYSDKKVEEARGLFEDMRRGVRQEMFDQLLARGYSGAEIRLVSALDDVTNGRMVAQAIRVERETLAQPQGRFAEKISKFNDWWAKKGGGETLGKRLKGNAWKAAALSPVGIIAGLGMGALLSPVVATTGAAVIGGVAAAAMARGVARGLASGRINSNVEALTVSRQQEAKRAEAQNDAIATRYDEIDYTDEDGEVTAFNDEVTDAHAEATSKEIGRNRKRLGTAALIGALAGGIAGSVAGNIGGFGKDVNLSKPDGPGNPSSEGCDTDGDKPPKTPSEPSNKPPEVPRNPGVEALSDGFNVEAGNGITHEIMDAGKELGVEISPDESFKIYEALEAKFGDDIVQGRGSYEGPDGDVRIASPGMAHWNPEAIQFLVNNMEELKKAADAKV